MALLFRYGAFSLYTGGDLYGMPEPGAPSFWDVETPIAKAIGKTDVMVVNHHGSIDVANPFFLATLAPRVIVVPAWSPTHPSPDVLKRLLSKRIWPGPRDVFVTFLRDATKATIGPREAQVASDEGHVVVRVAPGGATLPRLRRGRPERERRREVRARAVRVRRALRTCRSAAGRRQRGRVDARRGHGRLAAALPARREEDRNRPRGREVDDGKELERERRQERPVPADERDHRGADDDVENGVEALGGAAREERQEPELNGVGDDGKDARGEDAAP